MAGIAVESVAAAQGFAIDGDELLESRVECADVCDEAIAELFWFDECKYVRKCLCPGDAVGRFDPFLEPCFLEVAKFFNIGEGIHAAEDDGDDHEEDRAEVMTLVAASAGIFDDLECMK